MNRPPGRRQAKALVEDRALGTDRHRQQAQARHHRVRRAFGEVSATRREGAQFAGVAQGDADLGKPFVQVFVQLFVEFDHEQRVAVTPWASNARVSAPLPPPSSITRLVCGGSSATIAAASSRLEGAMAAVRSGSRSH
jgi:hypothetical protein